MELTPEQKAEVKQFRSVGETSDALKFTSQQRAEWKSTVNEELADKDANVEHFRKIKAASEQRGFLGDLRRAITFSRKPIQSLASEIGVADRLLSDFRAGEAELPSEALDRLVALLGLRLMQEIPR